MDISVIGPWVLLVLGSIILLAAVWVFVSGKSSSTKTSFVFAFGLAVAGVGVYGPVFLGSYGDFLSLITKMQESPGKESYAAFFEGVANGDVPEKYAKVGLAYALDSPIEGMDSLLASAAGKAQKPPAQRTLLTARDALRARQISAVQLFDRPTHTPSISEPALRILDPATRAYLVKPLLAAPDTTLARFRVDRRDVMTVLNADRPR